MPSQVMTVQGLLREACQLSLKEQIQLATQLLQSIDQQLENPATARDLTVKNLAAINSVATDPALDSSADRDIDTQAGSIDYLLANPIPVRGFKPLSRDEIYGRC